MVQDTSKLKENIMLVFKKRGPSLPVHVAKETGLSILFASAFLSELMTENKIKISNMRVGSSPIYFIPGQETMLEKFSEYLKSKEKEAFLHLKGKKFLKDSEQQPAIRVALRAIKDFAVPFKKGEEIYWRYFNISETEFEWPTPDAKKLVENKPEDIHVSPPVKSKEVPINSKTLKKKRTLSKKTKKISITKKYNEKFFNKVKEFLLEKNAEILEIISVNNSELILRIKTNNKEKILVAYNKKRMTEKEIINAYKKSQKFSLPFLVMSLGDISKKLSELIDAIKVLSNIEKIE